MASEKVVLPSDVCVVMNRWIGLISLRVLSDEAIVFEDFDPKGVTNVHGQNASSPDPDATEIPPK